MEFKQLEIKQDEKGIKRILTSTHFRKSAVYILTGAISGIVITYISNGMQYDVINTKDFIANAFFGAFVGFFITNSPCARNKC